MSATKNTAPTMMPKGGRKSQAKEVGEAKEGGGGRQRRKREAGKGGSKLGAKGCGICATNLAETAVKIALRSAT